MVRLTISIILLCAAGCTHLDLDPAPFDTKTGQLASLDDIDEEEVKVNKLMRGVKNLPFVYLITVSTDDAEEFDIFVRDSFAQIGFPKPLSREDLTRLIIKADLTGEVQDLTNIFSLHRLARVIGPYLIAQLKLIRITPQTWQLDAVILDPVEAETVFAVSRRKTMLFDFDREITWPMMNEVKQWFDRSAQLPMRKPNEQRPHIGA